LLLLMSKTRIRTVHHKELSKLSFLANLIVLLNCFTPSQTTTLECSGCTGIRKIRRMNTCSDPPATSLHSSQKTIQASWKPIMLITSYFSTDRRRDFQRSIDVCDIPSSPRVVHGVPIALTPSIRKQQENHEPENDAMVSSTGDPRS
jgi:hypothetical protein